MKHLSFWMLLGMSFSQIAWPHPELARHGYANCNTCHVSPTGGGILNPYGRSLSQALVSTWGTEEEALPFYGFIPFTEKIQAQASIRGVQSIRDNARAQSGEHLAMQTAIEAVGTYEKFSGVLSVDPSAEDSISPQHYLLLQVGEQTTFRSGKFKADYGINLANHSTSTRQGLGWGPGSESYNLELGHQGDFFSGTLTAILGKIDEEEHSERGFAANGSVFISDRFKVGASLFHGTQDNLSRILVGPYTILGFSPQFYFLNEIDLIFQQEKRGYVSYHKIGYDLIQGLQPYFIAETDVPDLSQKTGAKDAWGVGLLWNPRPHIEVVAEGKRRTDVKNSGRETFGFLTFSLYL